MTIVVNWANEEKTLLLWRFGQEWSNGDSNLALQETFQMLASVSHPVDLVFDLRAIVHNPVGLLRIAHNWHKTLHGKVNQLIVLDNASIFYSLYKMLEQQDPSTLAGVNFVNTGDDASIQVYADNKDIIEFSAIQRASSEG